MAEAILSAAVHAFDLAIGYCILMIELIGDSVLEHIRVVVWMMATILFYLYKQ